MLQWLFNVGREVTANLTGLAVCMVAAVPLAVLVVLKLSRRLRAEAGQLTTGGTVAGTAVLGTLCALTVVWWVLGQGGDLARDGLWESLATMLFGPVAYDYIRPVIVVVGVALIVSIAVMGARSLIAESGLLRERMESVRNPIRRRGKMGSASFCTQEDYRRFREPDPEGLTFFGAFWGQGRRTKKLRRLDEGQGRFCLSAEDVARGVLTIGGPGSGKTQSVILPAIADWMAAGHSVIVTDPQNELADYVKRFAAATGHQAVIHDPTSDHGARFNVAAGIRDLSEARAIADVLVPAGQTNDTDPFWRESAQALLAACLQRFENIGQIMLALGDLRGLARELARNGDDISVLATPFTAGAKGDKNLAAGIAATLATALTGWADESMRSATASSDFSADEIVERPTAVVLTCPGRQRAIYARYLGCVLRKLIMDLDMIGEENGGPLPVPVGVVMDEFPTFGRMDSLLLDVNLVRKRRISVLIAAQTKGQFNMIYGKEATDTLFAGLATQIVFGGCDQETASFYSHASGMTTETLPSGLGQALHVRQRPLLTPDEIQTPARGNATLFTRFVTESQATQVIMFSRLTRLYDRKDWEATLGGINSDDASIIARPLEEHEIPTP